VQEYLIDMNAKQAAIRCGYSAKTAEQQASRLLKDPEIVKALKLARDELVERTKISQDWVLNKLKEVAERCMQAEPITDKEGNPLGQYKFDSSGANRSLELIGKCIGMFNKVEVEGKVEHTGYVAMIPAEAESIEDWNASNLEATTGSAN